MIDPGLDSLFDGRHDGFGEVTGVCRCADLVENHAEFRFLASKAEHRLHEIVAKRAVEPCCANHHCPLAQAQHLLLAFELRPSIYAVRTCGLVFAIRLVVGAVEHVVRGNLNHPSAAPLDGLRQNGWSLGVEFPAEFLVALGFVHGSVGRAVHDAIYMVFTHELFHGIRIGDVEFGHVGVQPCVLRKIFLQKLHFVAQLAVAASNQYSHIL